MIIPYDVESVILCVLSAPLFSPMDLGLGNKEASLHFWWQKDGGCSSLWPSPPPVKTWLPWPQLSYRLSAQPLIPLSGTRGSRNFAITVCLHLLCARLYFLVCDRLQPSLVFLPPSFFSSCVSIHLSSSFWSPSSSHHLIILLFPHIILALPLDCVPTSLCCILLSSSLTLPSSLPSLSLCPCRCAFQFHSLPLHSLCKSALIHSQ